MEGHPVRRRLPVKVGCSSPGCDRLADSLGLCHKHYTRRRRVGTQKTEATVPNARAPWTEEELTALDRLHRQGLTDAAIAQELGRTYYAVRNTLYKLRKPSNGRDKPATHVRMDRRPTDPDTQPHPEFTNPIRAAFHYLHGRIAERNGLYWLDGTPADLTRIMRAVNALKRADGQVQFTASDQWVVQDA